MFQFLDINLKKICYSILRERWLLSLNLQGRKAYNLLLPLLFFAVALVEHNLTPISSCSHFCWHAQLKPESLQDVTALLAPSRQGPGGRVACSMFVSVYPLLVMMLFIHDALSQSPPLCRAAGQSHYHWLPTGNTAPSVGKVTSGFEDLFQCSRLLSFLLQPRM